MKRTPLLLLAAFALLPAAAFAQEKQQYIDDKITVTVRDAPRNDATYLGTVRSGDRVTVLESLGEQSFAKIRTSDGREGWITARFLTDEPAARTALEGVRRELSQAQSRIRELERDLAKAQGDLAQARPALELQRDNDELRAQMAELQRATQEVERRFNEQKARRSTMLAGAGLVGAGVLGGLLLPWIGRNSRRRRWGDF